jgi:MFS transporter, ACS family, glucarate transporter
MPRAPQNQPEGSPAKPTRARYFVVLLAISLAVLSYVQRVAISQAEEPITRDLHVSTEQMGLIFGAFALAYALFEVPMGLLGDRLGVRRVLTQIVLAWSVCTALTGAVWNITSMVVIRFLFGAGEAGCFPNLTRMLSAWMPARERVTAQALMWAFARWGGAITPPLALLAITLFGWRWAFVHFALAGIVWCAVFLFWFRDDPAQHRSVNDAERQLLESSRVLITHRAGEGNWLSVLLTRPVLILGLQYFCFSSVWYFYITWLPKYLREARGQTGTREAILATLPLLFGGAGCLITGLAHRRLPRRAIAICGFLATAILLYTATRIQSVVPSMLAMAFASMASDLTMPISWDACVEIGGPYCATVAACMNMMGNLGGFVAPFVGGVILARTHGNWNLLIELMAGLAIISALCWLYLDPEAARREREISTESVAVSTDSLTP